MNFAALPTEYPTAFMWWVVIVTIVLVILFIMVIVNASESFEGAEFTGDIYKANLPFSGRRSDGSGDPRFDRKLMGEGFMTGQAEPPVAWPYHDTAVSQTHAGKVYEGFNKKDTTTYKGAFAESTLRRSAEGL
jgi:hypothetical protein